MFYRTVAIFIVLFWLTMTGLLVHQQVRPGDSALREVPPAHVVKLLFMHHQPSNLNIYSDKLRLGQLVIEPETRSRGRTATSRSTAICRSSSRVASGSASPGKACCKWTSCSRSSDFN